MGSDYMTVQGGGLAHFYHQGDLYEAVPDVM